MSGVTAVLISSTTAKRVIIVLSQAGIIRSPGGKLGKPSHLILR